SRWTCRPRLDSRPGDDSMSDGGQVLSETLSPGIVRLTLDRPAKRNALNEAMLGGLLSAFEQMQQAGDVRAAILQGNGPAFCSGMDLSEATDPVRGPKLATKISQVLEAI